MAAQQVTQYGQELAYGIGTSESITVGNYTGWLISATTSREGDSKTYKNQQGLTKSLIIAEQWEQASLEVLLFKNSSDKELPKKGDTISGIPSSIIHTASGGSVRCESCSVQWQNEDVARVSITARAYTF